MSHKLRGKRVVSESWSDYSGYKSGSVLQITSTTVQAEEVFSMVYGERVSVCGCPSLSPEGLNTL